ncbi:class I SAM-dependent methyltransferase [Geobacter sp. FeAm09]|uniref:class I SAM-dependent methyltransferase n=1 Tax=Geobacter sp. FeAm09 TaxID=2597769 RepID=UPI0011EE63B3|nr:class I SAM-dependent methyltransferase [Geobacter sp. FeAm09]QEM67836.1 class I SAM-dependent methyltransferase [Geobacter sp. FeAm09]
MEINARKFDDIARTIFAPAYPLLAGQIIERTRVTRGLCLDLGSGGGYLGLALVEKSDLQVCLLDESGEMQRIAEANITDRGLADRAWAVKGDVHSIPLQDGCVDLVVSRSSLFFWNDLVRAFGEIDRVLAPGGHAYVGGGFGSREVRDRIVSRMRERTPDWQPKYNQYREDGRYVGSVRAAGISDFRATRDESGFWITFQKTWQQQQRPKAA